MQLHRRSLLRSTLYGCLGAFLNPLSSLSQALPPDEVNVIATVLRAQCGKGPKHPVLIATERFSTGRMTVLTTEPTPIQKAAHQLELPYLLPSADRMGEAEELSAAYNSRLKRAAPAIAETAVFTFPHRLLDGQALSQFEDLYLGGNVYSAELEKKRHVVSSRSRLFFDGSTTVWKVSRVAFNFSGTLAVVGLRSSGGSCYSESWHVLERSQGAWHRMPWGGGIVTCA